LKPDVDALDASTHEDFRGTDIDLNLPLDESPDRQHKIGRLYPNTVNAWPTRCGASGACHHYQHRDARGGCERRAG